MSGSGGLRMFHVQGQQKKKLYVSAESCDIFRVQRGELLLFFFINSKSHCPMMFAKMSQPVEYSEKCAPPKDDAYQI